MLRIYPTPDTPDEFRWRRRYASLVADQMDQFRQAPSGAAQAARVLLLQEWRQRFGEEALPFSIRLDSERPLSGLPGGVETEDGRVWLTAAYVEEGRTAFPEEERLTHEGLAALVRNYDPEFRAASLTLPTGNGGSHDTGRLNPQRAGRIDAVDSDGQHLWVLVRPQGENFEAALLQGLENRSVSWFELLPDLEEPGPYLDHLAILSPGEQPGQPGHIPLDAFADLRTLAEAALFGSAEAQQMAAARSLPGVTVQRRDYAFPAPSDPPTANSEEPSMSEEVQTVAETEDTAPQDPATTDRTLRPKERADAGNSRQTPALEDRLEALERTLARQGEELAAERQRGEEHAEQVRTLREERDAAQRSALVQEIDSAIEALVRDSRIPAGEQEACRARFLTEDGVPRASQAETRAWLDFLAKGPKVGPSPQPFQDLSGSGSRSSGLGKFCRKLVQAGQDPERVAEIQSVIDHIEGGTAVDEPSPKNRALFVRKLTDMQAGEPLEALLGEAN